MIKHSDITVIIPVHEWNENVEKLFEFKGKNENNLNVGFSIVARAENKNEVENFKRKWSKYGYVRVIKLGGWVDKDLSEG